MAEFFPPVIFEVKAKATEAIAEFGKVNTELAKMEKNGVLAGGALGKMEKAGKLAGTAFLGLAGAVGVLGVASLKTLDTFEKSQANLSTAVTDTGVSFAAAEPVIKAHADQMKNLGFAYTDTYDALAKMTAASGSPQVALNTLSAAADLARFKNISLADAGTLLARATIGQAKGLGDLGIAIGKTLPKGASLAQILKAVEDRAGGAASAFKDTLGGSLAVAQANFQALEISIGTKLLPYAIKFTNWISRDAIPALKSFFDWADKNRKLFIALAAVLATIWAIPKIAGLITAIGTITAAFKALTISATEAEVAEEGAVGAAGAGGILAKLGLSFAAGGLAYNQFLTPKGVTQSQIDAYNKAHPGVSNVFGPNIPLPKDFYTYNKTTPTPSANPNLTGKGVARVASTTKTKATSVKAAEKGNVTVNVHYDGTKVATHKSQFGG